MRLKSLLTAMLLLTGFSMAKADIVEIGTAENSFQTRYLPTYTDYNYSITQQIYRHFEMGPSRGLSSIDFFCTGAEAVTRTIDIYLTLSNTWSFGSGTDWIPVSESELVFSGEVTFLPDQWNTITFNQEYFYDNNYNLVVTVDDNTGICPFMDGFSIGYCDNDVSLYGFSDTDNFDPTNMGTYYGDLLKGRNQIRFNGEEEIIGLPASRFFPTTTLYKYAVSEQIYTADEIGGKGLISSISFFNTTQEDYRYIEVYLMHTAKSSFDNDHDWLSLSSGDMVFSGAITFTKGAWNEIKLDTPFMYDGIDNLAVIVCDKSGTYQQNTGFAAYEGVGNQCIFEYDDNIQFDPTGMGSYSGYLSTYKNQIRLDIDKNLIGDGGSEYSDILPFNCNFSRSLSQQIYTKEEVGEARDLTSISFHNLGHQLSESLNIYLVPTYATDFADGNSWIPFNEGNLVFSGDVTFDDEDWTTITFDRPFSYNGKTNLALVVALQSPVLACDSYFSVFPATGMSLVSFSIPLNEYPTSESLTGSTGYVYDWKNQIRFNHTDEVLPKPQNFSVDNLPYSAELSWEGEGELWELQYGVDTYPMTWQTEMLSTNHYTMTYLHSNELYYARVRTVYPDGSVSRWAGLQFHTPLPDIFDVAVNPRPTSASISWTGYPENTYDVMYFNTQNFETVFYDDFEDGFSKGWTIITNGESVSSDGWITTDAKSFSDVYAAAAYSWTQDSGALNADNWLISPLVDLKGTLSFWQYAFSSFPDEYEVKLSTSGNDISDFVYTLRPLAPGLSEWNEMRFDLSPYEGEKGYIAIHHKSNNNIALYIDDFHIFTGEMKFIHTLEPNVLIEDLEPNTIYGYSVYIHKFNDYSVRKEPSYFSTLPTNPAPFALIAEPGITSANLFWTGYSDSYQVRYRTAEEKKEVVLFFDGFEEGFEAQGWTAIRNGEGIESTDWQTSDVIPHDGSYSAVSGSWDSSEGAFNVDNYLISPQIDLKGELKYQVCCGNSAYPENYRVLLSTTGKDLADFTIALRDLQPVTNTSYEEVVIDLSAFEGQKGYIAFQHLEYDKTHLYIDDVCVCQTNILKPAGEWHEIETTETDVTIVGLDRETTYEYQVIGRMTGYEDTVSESSFFTTVVAEEIAFDAKGDNSSDIFECNAKWANVTIQNYTIKKDGKWHSICLPFYLTLEGSPLEGAELRQPSDAKEVDTYLIIDCLTSCDELEAGLTYLYKFEPGEDIVNPVFKEVIINNFTTSTELYGGKVYVIPNYDRFVVLPSDDFYYCTDGNLRLARINLQKDCSMDAFQCSFYIDSSLNNNIDGIGLNFGDMSMLDLITGIKTIGNGQQTAGDAIYNVAGQRLSKMQKGVNIVGDKKVLVK